MKSRYGVLMILTFLIFFGFLFSISFADDWRSEFDEICAQVSVADDLSSEELQDLVKRVDDLIPRVESSGDPQSKVFIFRLKKCKDLFNFILDTRN